MKKILVVSDLQVGSQYSLWPEKFTFKDGGRWILSDKQRTLQNAWHTFIKYIAGIKPDILILNGDMIEGPQVKQQGTSVITTNFAEQAKAAEIILTPLRQSCTEAYLIRGTEYHDTVDGQAIESLGENLGVIPFRKNQFSDWVLNLDVEGVIINVSHHIGVMQGFYRATAPDREGIWSALAGRSKTPDADCIVRSHIHIFVHVEHSNKHIVVTPGWQLQTDYQIKKSYYRMFPEIGAILIHTNPAKKVRGEDPIQIQKLLFKMPRDVALVSKA